ncbi:MAG: glycosyltransferase family 2 protein [Selenomonadaceae bacterium]|nr:glycosyltransferase family 2 protein [Selenomonadaceae bacterium]
MRKDFDAFTARIDIKLLPETDMADFKIISISDDRAGVWKPDLFQKGGIGYVIYSYAGKLEFITKASSDGKVRLNLRGINVYASEDKSEQNFEVIVVDDCSKDSSCKVIESYIPKFNGRLSLYHMSRNSGSAPAPRNNGFLVSRGEYIFFMDSDDTLTKTALEEIYTLAKEYDADVVYCEKYYMSTGVGEEYIKNIHLADNRIQKPPFVDKPTFISDKLSDRLDDLLAGKFWVTPWQRFVSRKLLAENEINFPEIIG